MSNFGDISQSIAEILLILPVSENKGPSCWNSASTYDFHVRIPSGCHSEFTCQIASKSDHPWQRYDDVSIFQNGGHGITILLPVSFFVTLLIWEGWNPPADQISERSQSTADILLLPFSENKHPPC